jgi:hypothetical protein
MADRLRSPRRRRAVPPGRPPPGLGVGLSRTFLPDVGGRRPAQPPFTARSIAARASRPWVDFRRLMIDSWPIVVSRMLEKLELNNRVQIALLAHDAGEA